MSCEILRYLASERPKLEDLERLATAEEYGFIKRTREEWESGVNRFDRPGECFFIAHISGVIIGICGLNVDPYVDDYRVGRLRHLYVHPGHRRVGIAIALVSRCLSFAHGNFDLIRLRTLNPVAAGLYRSLGFEDIEDPSATHKMLLA